MVSQKTAAPDTDEEIIDLTDIIEKGAVPASRKGDDLDSQMSDLYAKGGAASPAANPDVDADIDALLSQMNSGDAPGNGPAEDAGYVVNPNETLSMPGMDDVDALLGNLDIPPQPRPGTQNAPAASQENAEELDSLLNTMMDKTPAPSAAAEETAPLGELDALFNQSAQPQASAPGQTPAAAQTAQASQKSADEFDLDALLGDGPAPVQPQPAPAPQEPAQPKAASSAPPDSLDDLDALFNQSAQPQASAPGQTPVATRNAQASQKSADEFDLDALLGDGPAPAQPQPADAPPEPAQPKAVSSAPADSLDDLDALFNQSAQPQASAPGQTPVATRNAQASQKSADEFDLDALLGDGPAPAQPQPAPALQEPAQPKAASSAPADSLDDLDALFNQSAQPQASAPGQTPAAAQTAQASQKSADEFDLDALLGDGPAPAQPQPVPAPQEPAQPKTAMPQTRPTQDELDALLGDIPTEEITSETSEDEEVDAEELSRAAQELLDEKVMLEATTSGDVDTDAWMHSLDETLEEVEEKGAEEAQHSVQLPADKALDEEVASLLPSDEELDALLQDEQSAVARAVPSDIMDRLAQQEKELRELRTLTETYARDLTAAEARLTAMEAVPPPPPVPTPSLDELLQEGSPLYSGLVELVCSAVATALSEQEQAQPPAPVLPPNLEQRLLALEQSMEAQAGADDSGLESRLIALEEQSLATEAMSARLDTLETRVDALPLGIVETLTQRLDALEDPAAQETLEQRLAALEQRPEAPSLDVDVLQQRIADLERAVAVAPAAAELEERITALEQRSKENSSDSTPLEQRLATLENTVSDSLAQRLEALEAHMADAAAAPEALSGRISALEEDAVSLQTLEERIATLEQHPEAPAADTEALERRIAAMENAASEPAALPEAWEERLAALEARPEAPTEAVQELTQRMDALEQWPEPSLDAEALQQRIAALEAAVAAVPAATDLEERIATLEQRPEAPAADTEALERRIAAMENAASEPAALPEAWEERLAALEARPEAPTEAVQELTQRIDALEESTERKALEQRLDALERRSAEDSVDLTPLEQRIATLEEAAASPAATDGTEERLAALETKLHTEIAGLEQTVDKAAATAAARIIREEIAALMSA